MKFAIRPRKAWCARPARSRVYQSPDSIHTLVIHHTAGDPTGRLPLVKRMLRSIQNDHMDRHGWSDIGYNYAIDRFGRVWEGRGHQYVGAHTANHNTGTIGVAFLGNYEKQKPNRRQLAALRALVNRLADRGIDFEHIKGHKQMPNQATACPGRHLMKALDL